MQIRFTGFICETRMRERYPSDFTDAQWARIAPLFYERRRVQVRAVLNDIFYVMKNGCVVLADIKTPCHPLRLKGCAKL